MKVREFQSYVARLVEKGAQQPLSDVDPEADILLFWDEGMEPQDQVTMAHLAATEVLEENGYLVVG
jgi:hypothetical protein